VEPNESARNIALLCFVNEPSEFVSAQLSSTLLDFRFVMALFPVYTSRAHFHYSGYSYNWFGSSILATNSSSTMQLHFTNSCSLRYSIPAIHSENSDRIAKFQNRSSTQSMFRTFSKTRARKYSIEQAEPEPSTDAITSKLSHVVFCMNANPQKRWKFIYN